MCSKKNKQVFSSFLNSFTILPLLLLTPILHLVHSISITLSKLIKYQNLYQFAQHGQSMDTLLLDLLFASSLILLMNDSCRLSFPNLKLLYLPSALPTQANVLTGLNVAYETRHHLARRFIIGILNLEQLYMFVYVKDFAVMWEEERRWLIRHISPA